MTLTDVTAGGQTDTLSFALDLHHSPAKVWRALSDPNLLARWPLPAVGFSLAPGAAFTFTAPAQPGWDGSVHCRLLELEAQRTLRYTWCVGDLETALPVRTPPGCQVA